MMPRCHVWTCLILQETNLKQVYVYIVRHTGWNKLETGLAKCDFEKLSFPS